MIRNRSRRQALHHPRVRCPIDIPPRRIMPASSAQRVRPHLGQRNWKSRAVSIFASSYRRRNAPTSAENQLPSLILFRGFPGKNEKFLRLNSQGRELVSGLGGSWFTAASPPVGGCFR